MQKNKNNLISEVLLWTPLPGYANIDQQAKTYIHQFWLDTGYFLEHLPKAIPSSDGWRKRERERESLLPTRLEDDDDDDDDEI